MKHFLHPWPLHRAPASRRLIRVLSWSLFIGRGAGELSAGNTRICSRANKNNSREVGRIQGGVEAGANLEGPLCPEQPRVSGLLMTSSWVGSLIMAPGTWAFSDLQFAAWGLVTHTGSRSQLETVLFLCPGGSRVLLLGAAWS